MFKRFQTMFKRFKNSKISVNFRKIEKLGKLNFYKCSAICIRDGERDNFLFIDYSL